MAEWVGPEGAVEIFDVQQEFLDHTMRRAGERGLENVVPTQGDATARVSEDSRLYTSNSGLIRSYVGLAAFILLTWDFVVLLGWLVST